MMTHDQLKQQNRRFAGTGGVSANNCQHRFIPAFQDTLTGRIELSRFGDGRRAPMHLLDGLPDAWAIQRNTKGIITAVLESVIAGFVRSGEFYTREQAAAAIAA